jgi:hypothetical protein
MLGGVSILSNVEREIWGLDCGTRMLRGEVIKRSETNNKNAQLAPFMADTLCRFKENFSR